MQEVTLTIPVKTNASVSPEEIAKIVQRLIDIGLADAAATVEESGNSGDGDFKAAEMATDLHIGAPVVEKKPRVLVVVSAGFADPIYDEGVDVEVFDWDSYNNEEDDAKTGVPVHFADLAEAIDVPVEGESMSKQVTERNWSKSLRAC